MNNAVRYLIATMLLPIVCLVVLIFIITLTPVLIIAGIAIHVMITALLVILLFLTITTFLYYISRKEPKTKQTKHSNHYLIASGKRR